jgi:hypothetical protein
MYEWEREREKERMNACMYVYMYVFEPNITEYSTYLTTLACQIGPGVCGHERIADTTHHTAESLYDLLIGGTREISIARENGDLNVETRQQLTNGCNFEKPVSTGFSSDRWDLEKSSREVGEKREEARRKRRWRRTRTEREREEIYEAMERRKQKSTHHKTRTETSEPTISGVKSSGSS